MSGGAGAHAAEMRPAHAGIGRHLLTNMRMRFKEADA
jgi:hypothetical protein